MTSPTDAQTFVVGGSATQPQRFVLGEGETVDDVQASGAWLATADPVEVSRHR